MSARLLGARDIKAHLPGTLSWYEAVKLRTLNYRDQSSRFSISPSLECKADRSYVDRVLNLVLYNFAKNDSELVRHFW